MILHLVVDRMFLVSLGQSCFLPKRAYIRVKFFFWPCHSCKRPCGRPCGKACQACHTATEIFSPLPNNEVTAFSVLNRIWDRSFVWRKWRDDDACLLYEEEYHHRQCNTTTYATTIHLSSSRLLPATVTWKARIFYRIARELYDKTPSTVTKSPGSNKNTNGCRMKGLQFFSPVVSKTATSKETFRSDFLHTTWLTCVCVFARLQYCYAF